jgi:uncharacterized protein
MSESFKSEAGLESELCPTCGLCCNGVIFADVRLRPGDDAARLRSLGLPVTTSPSSARPPRLTQPCAAFDGCRCRVYADRPQYCRAFECVLFKSVKAGRTDLAAALRVIRTARARADKVRRLLAELGNTDEQLPLSTRFRDTANQLEGHDLDEAAADTYGQLTLAVHDLNLLLGDAFYPGTSDHEPKRNPLRAAVAAACAALTLFAAAGPLQADQVELQNGDRYVGHVLSLNTDTVVLQSDVLGTLRLPRSKVAIISLGPIPATNSPSPSAVSPVSTNAGSSLNPASRGLSFSTNLIQQVQKQFLSGAGADANNKFNELLGGLMSGKLSVDDIRAEAKSAADQLRALQRESGEDAGFAASAYLAILDHFLKETAPSASSTTNAPTPSAGTKAKPTPEEE